MTARLVAAGGPLSGATLSLTQPAVSVGRDETNAIALADPSVSPNHCLFVQRDGRVAIRDVDGVNPTFVNGLPNSGEPLTDGDRIQIGQSVFVFQASAPDAAAADDVEVRQTAGVVPATTIMRREELFTRNERDSPSPARAARDLDALVRIGAAIGSIRGLVALERPLLELIGEVLPARRGAVVLLRDRAADADSAVGWSRGGGATSVPVSRSLVERVTREAVGVLSDDRSTIAVPLVAFDKLVGTIVLETDAAAEPFDRGHLRLVMAIASSAGTSLEHARQVEALEETTRRLQDEISLDHSMVGQSAAMRAVYGRIARVAPADSTVLITGESGTGKELVARAIHRNSPRAEKPFVAINCAAITETLLESELFGHEKGAFTGAIALKKGKLELAEGGTVFLDEIGELSPALQVKLLRVLQEREFDRVGGSRPVHVDFRLVAATNQELSESIEAGSFRRDLFYRLNVVSILVPPLRDRKDDIPVLANWFVRRHGSKAKRPVSGVSPDALACLTAYDWPGNVRELENAIEHAVVLGADAFIVPDDLPEAVAESGSSGEVRTTRRFHDAVKQTKKELIIRAVEETEGNYNAAARLLGLHPNYLHRLIRNLQVKSSLKKS